MNSVYPSRAAEKVLFREQFRNAADVARNGGTLVGAPVIKDGAILDGAADYTVHALAGLLSGRSILSSRLEIWPDFDYDLNDVISLFSSTSNHYRAYKHNNAGGNVLGIVLGGTLVQEIASAVWSPSWVVGGRNTLVISSNGATTDAWLNGTQILTADPTAWTPTNPANLYLGARANGTGKVDGTIHSFDFRAGLLTQADVDLL